MRSASGAPKASVLPDPVGDLTRTSWPARTSGATIVWTGKGSEIPRAVSAPATASDRPSSANDIWVLLRKGWGDSTDPNRVRTHLRDKNLACERFARPLTVAAGFAFARRYGLHAPRMDAPRRAAGPRAGGNRHGRARWATGRPVRPGRQPPRHAVLRRRRPRARRRGPLPRGRRLCLRRAGDRRLRALVDAPGARLPGVPLP